jgi:hypothetical protein
MVLDLFDIYSVERGRTLSSKEEKFFTNRLNLGELNAPIERIVIIDNEFGNGERPQLNLMS